MNIKQKDIAVKIGKDMIFAVYTNGSMSYHVYYDRKMQDVLSEYISCDKYPKFDAPSIELAPEENDYLMTFSRMGYFGQEKDMIIETVTEIDDFFHAIPEIRKACEEAISKKINHPFHL